MGCVNVYKKIEQTVQGKSSDNTKKRIELTDKMYYNNL